MAGTLLLKKKPGRWIRFFLRCVKRLYNREKQYSFLYTQQPKLYWLCDVMDNRLTMSYLNNKNVLVPLFFGEILPQIIIKLHSIIVDKNTYMPGKNNTDKKNVQNSILTEEERLRQNIYRSDMEKLRLFTKMLRTNSLFKKAVITHK